MSAHAGYKDARAISEAAREKEWKLPSFGKALYLGDFQPELISPQPDLPADSVERAKVPGRPRQVPARTRSILRRSSVKPGFPMR